MRQMILLSGIIAGVLGVAHLGGCSTAPKFKDQPAFLEHAESTRGWFKTNVTGLREQIRDSAGHIVFPGVGQWGLLYGGGTFGRGALYSPDGTQLGWAAINVQSIGLQVGVQGFRMLMVLENEKVLQEYRANKLTGSVNGVVVGVKAGGSAAASFTRGVAVYQGANKGLMAGLSIGLNSLLSG